MSNNVSQKNILAELEEATIKLRTESVTNRVLLVLCHMVLIEKGTVVDLRKLLDELILDPQKGARFISRFDAFLKARLELHGSVITETFIKEINDTIDLFNPEREESVSDPFAQIGSAYSRLYGKNSAWN